MARRDTAFPHPDIQDQGPPIEAALAAFGRESEEYWHRRPGDHGVTGLFTGGPESEHCAIAGLQIYTHCAVSAATPEGARKQDVTYKGRRAAQLLDDSTALPLPRMVTTGGRYARPVKPANSGRKRKVA